MNNKFLKTTSVEDIVAHIQANHKRPADALYTLTTVVTEKGYEVGIADNGQRGYTETGLVVDEPQYNKACDIVDECNSILFPGRNKKENMIIQLSTMRS